MRRLAARAAIGVALIGTGAGAATAVAGSPNLPEQYLVVLGHQNGSSYNTITVFVTRRRPHKKQPKPPSPYQLAVTALEGMGAPAPSQHDGTERVTVRPYVKK